MSDQRTVNYSRSFDCIVAHGEGRQVLILRALEKPFRRADGIISQYELENRWTYMDCVESDDGAVSCVDGNDFTYWTFAELKKLGVCVGTKAKPKLSPEAEHSLFAFFNLH